MTSRPSPFVPSTAQRGFCLHLCSFVVKVLENLDDTILHVTPVSLMKQQLLCSFYKCNQLLFDKETAWKSLTLTLKF